MNTDDRITAVLALRKARRVVVFSGAGISAESGIPTFRDAGGFWQRFPRERFSTWKGLAQTALTSPRSVAEFVLNVVEPIAIALPNPAHRAVAQLADYVPTTVVTQNVDGLHQSAGSQQVLEIHGSLLEVANVATGRIVRRFVRSDLVPIAEILRRYAIGQSSLFSLLRQLRRQYPFDWLARHRPRLVMFGESMAEPAWSQAWSAVDECDVFITVGTSAAVLPAALLPEQAARNGATVITIDPQPSFGCWLEGPAGTVLPELVRDAFAKKAT